MNIYKTPNDIEVGDYPYRVNNNWCNVVWVITPHCNLGCPYCIGFAYTGHAQSMMDSYPVEFIVEKFERMRDENHMNIYITMTGGEPTLLKSFIPLCKALAKKHFIIEIQTNMVTKGFKKFVNEVSPISISQIMATYHGWILDKRPDLFDLYMSNFKLAWKNKFTTVLKKVVQPKDVFLAEEKFSELKKSLPEGAPVMPWIFIQGQNYPYNYNKEQKEVMKKICKVRHHCQMNYMYGGGWYQGMRCDAGKGFIVMDWDGNIRRCWSIETKQKFIESPVVYLNNTEEPPKCTVEYCQTPFWGLWYGVNPWEYIKNSERKDAYYCRFGPTCFPENISL